MCLICVELQKNRMTSREAWRALGEMVEVLEEGHAEEVVELIDQKAQEENEQE